MPEIFTVKKAVTIGITEWKKNDKGYNYFEDSKNDNKATSVGKGLKLEEDHSSVVADVNDWGSFQVITKILKYPDAAKVPPFKATYKKGGYVAPPVTDPRVFELKELRDLLNREIAICSNIVPPLSGKVLTLEALEKRMVAIREMAYSNVKFIMSVYPFLEKKEEVVAPVKEVGVEGVAKTVQTDEIKQPEEVVIPF
jgi:hypothetical protein